MKSEWYPAEMNRMMEKNIRSNHFLSLAFNRQWLKENLPPYLWRENEISDEIAHVEILHVWESSKRITILYQIDLKRSNGEIRQQMYVGYLVADERFADEQKSALKKGKIQPLTGRAVTIIPEANLILLAYPNDRKMQLLSAEDLQSWLGEHWREIADDSLNGNDWRIQNTKVEMLRYVPDKRFTALCRVRLQDENALSREVSFVAKQLSDEKKAKRLYRNLRLLQTAWPENSANRRSRLTAKPPIRLPKALAWDEKRAVVFIEEIAGKNLKQALPEIDPARVMPAVGALLAIFHRARKRVRKQVTIKNELAEVREAMRTIAKALPHLKRRMRQFYKQFKTWRWEDEAPQVLLHGTYRLNHIFINGSELALLDLDSLRLGHPAYDLANFLSSLYYLEEQQRLTQALRRDLARHFLEGYTAETLSNIHPGAVLWFLASLLINKQASKYVNHDHEDQEEKVMRMLALAEATLSDGQNLPGNLTLSALWKVLQ